LPTVPITDDPSRRDGRILTDGEGREVGRFVVASREGFALADLFELAPGVTIEQAVPVIVAELPGHVLAGDVPLGQALLAVGARAGRHAHVLSRDLVADPAPPEWQDAPVPDGLRLGPLDRPAEDLADAALAAYPPEHVDNAHLDRPIDHPRELVELIAGRSVGPLLRCSGLAVDAHDAVVGAVLVNDDHGTPPYGGPWVTQVFRGPGGRGAGRALLMRALGIATADGLSALGLAVTHGNPAQRLYEELGFRHVVTAFNVRVP
jgi:GNAT superfamily N-acetyltransferase